MNYLIIDSSNKQLYIGIVDSNQNVFEHVHMGNNDHSETLMFELERLLKKSNLKIDDINKIIVSEGPGSYTGIRIGMTVAKIFAWDKGIKLYRTSSFVFLISSFLDKDGVYSLVFDARRNNGFCGIFQVENNELKLLREPVFTKYDDFVNVENEFDNIIKINGSNDFKVDVLKLINSKYIYEVEDIHSFVPNYLRKWEE